MFELQWPWLMLLAPLPLLVLRLPRIAQPQAAALRVPFFQRLRGLGVDAAAPRRDSDRLNLLLLGLMWLALLLAASRPVWIGEAAELPTSGRDLMLAVDISGSMLQEDMIVDDNALPRITVVKAVVGEFIHQRRGDKLGLILFGSQAYMQSPLSFDIDTLGTLLEEAQVGFAGKATAIGDAIGFAIKRLRQRPDNSRVLILLTDGADTASSLKPAQAAELAATEGVKIYTIGFGATEMEVPGLWGTRLGARTINPSADLDEATLRAIAERTGGEFFRARSPAELQAAYRAIAELEPIEQEAELLRPQASLLQWPLLLALLLMLAVALRHSGLLNGGLKRAD